jgi:hypothetical protein
LEHKRRVSADVVAFVFLAYMFTWLFRVPLAASAAGIIDIHVPRYFQFLARHLR